MRVTLYTTFLLFLVALAATAGEIREIELFDGSRVTGEVLSLSNGTYTVRTRSLGTITIPEQNIRSIQQQGSASSSPPGASAASDSLSLQMRMMKDQEVMTLIESLKNDPDFQKALQDPELMRAVNAGDVAALSASPEFLRLLQHSTVQDIQRKMGQ